MEVHVGERLHGAEALVDAVEVENGNAHVPVAPFARPGCRAGAARPAGPEWAYWMPASVQACAYGPVQISAGVQNPSATIVSLTLSFVTATGS